MKKTFLMMAVLLMMGSAAFAGGGFDIAIGPKVGYTRDNFCSEIVSL